MNVVMDIIINDIREYWKGDLGILRECIIVVSMTINSTDKKNPSTSIFINELLLSLLNLSIHNNATTPGII